MRWIKFSIFPHCPLQAPVLSDLICYFATSNFTCVKVHAFQAPNKGHLEAQYKRQSLLFEIWLNKLLLGKKLPKLQNTCYKVSWGVKMTATQSSTIPLSVQRLKESSFTLFRHVFWKRTIFKGVPVSGNLGTLVPKVHWGNKKMMRKKYFNGKPIWPFPVEILWAYSFKSAPSGPSVFQSCH